MTRKAWFLGIVLIAGLILAFFYITSRPKIEVSLQVSGTGPGWVNITLVSNARINSARLVLARGSSLVSCHNNSCLFRYWVRPSEPGGNYKAKIWLNTSLGLESLEKEVFINVSNNWKEIDGILFYGGNASEVSKMFKSENVSVFAYFTSAQSSQNSEVIQAEVLVIAGLKALNKSVHYYALTIDGSKCIYSIPGENKTEEMNYSECLAEMGKEPGIVIDLPRYPGSQVQVTREGFVLQSGQGELRNLAKNFMIFLAKHIKE